MARSSVNCAAKAEVESIMDTGQNGKAEGGATWPFYFLFGSMWAGMIGTTLNTDPIRPGLSASTAVMLPLLIGVLALFAWARWRGSTFFAHRFPTLLGNLAWHVFVMTGVIFLSYLVFDAVVQFMMSPLGIPVFEPGCKVSERDTALFVWDAMAKGAFKFVARYLHVPSTYCAYNSDNLSVEAVAQFIRWYTALVVVWHIVSFVTAWVRRLRTRT